MFSYGSGCAASLFGIECVGDYKNIQVNGDFTDIIEKRIKLTPEQYTEIMNEREQNHGKAPFKPKSTTENLRNGAFYLKEMDSKYRRVY